MSDPYVGEIRMFGGNFAPAGWMFCSGQLLPISEYETLFNLIGTTYGGDGQSTFALPDLQGRFPNHMGTGNGLSTYIQGQAGGVESVTLTPTQLPTHGHAAVVSTSSGTSNNASGNMPGASPNIDLYVDQPPAVALNAAALQPSLGSSQPHDNMHPFLAVSFIISLFGIFPSPT